MILRIVRGRVLEGRLGTLAETFLSSYEPVARATPGLVRYHVAVRPTDIGHEVALVTFWLSVDSVLAALGDLEARVSLAGIDHDLDLDTPAYFEVDETQLRRSEDFAAILRITVGRVGHGEDAAIQQELRARVHELDDDMTEAYVGRRIVGPDVEVAFVSAWQRLPLGPSLDGPIWPDISSRYDRFEVATFVPLISGIAPKAAA